MLDKPEKIFGKGNEDEENNNGDRGTPGYSGEQNLYANPDTGEVVTEKEYRDIMEDKQGNQK